MPMTAADRKAEMVRRGVRQADIARALGVSPSHVAQVIAGVRRSPNVEPAVAEAIGLPVDDVFPPAPASAPAA